MRISDWSSDVCSSDLESSRSGFSRELSSAWQTASRILKQETITQKETPQPRLRGFGVKTLAMTYSRMLNAHYHRRVRVSLPSSGWDRVVPRSYCHQGEGGGSRSRWIGRYTRTRARGLHRTQPMKRPAVGE